MNSYRSEFCRLISIVAVGLCFALAGCVAVQTKTVAPAAPVDSRSATNSILDSLYFGRAIPSGGEVSEEQWAAFLAEVVTPRFPDGLTVWRTNGQWRDAKNVIWREPGFVLQLIHAGGANPDRAVAEIIAEYKKRFAQDSVLRVRSRVEVQF